MIKFLGSCLFAAGALLLANPAIANNECVSSPDINGDGYVDEADLEALKAAFATIEGDSDFNPNADINGDGLITTADYSAMLGCS